MNLNQPNYTSYESSERASFSPSLVPARAFIVFLVWFSGMDVQEIARLLLPSPLYCCERCSSKNSSLNRGR